MVKVIPITEKYRRNYDKTFWNSELDKRIIGKQKKKIKAGIRAVASGHFV
jgi:hypothetical protein